MSSTPARAARPPHVNPLAPFLDHPDLPLPGLLSPADIDRGFAEHHVCFGTAHNTLFTPLLTLWAVLSLVVFPDKSTAAACARVSALLHSLEQASWSQDTGVFCRARARLAALALRGLALLLADRLQAAAPPAWLWRGLHVKLADGTTLVLPDTPQIRAAFPLMRSQKPGLAFPLLRLVALLSLATGAICGLAWGPYKGKGTGETALLRQLLGRITANDLIVLDRYFGNYWTIAELLRAGAHVCVRRNASRQTDWDKGERLGHHDHVVTWKRPRRPAWMSEAEYLAFPEELTLREVVVAVTRRGFRTEQVVVVTDLKDPAVYSKDDIAELYGWRWQVEVDLRHLKATLRMRELSCKTPQGVAAELWSHALAYNLVRKVMAQAALQPLPCKRPSRLRRDPRGPVTPRQISFKAALHQIQANWQRLSTAGPEEYLEVARQILTTLAKKRLRQRPGRQEPRAVKKRPRHTPVLKRPRAEAKALLVVAQVDQEGGGSGQQTC